MIKILGYNERFNLFEASLITNNNIGGGVKLRGECVLNEKTVIGNKSVLDSIRVIGSGKCEIGSYCHFGYSATIITSNHNYMGDGIPYDDTDIEKPVIIKDFVWIGANVTILPGVTIHEGAIIQAGSVVREDVPYLGIAGGNPGVVFKYRDEKEWNKLKNQEKFY